MRERESLAEHADRMARDHPRGHLRTDASPEERGAALERVLVLAEALRRPRPPERSRAMSIHEVIRRGGA